MERKAELAARGRRALGGSIRVCATRAYCTQRLEHESSNEAMGFTQQQRRAECQRQEWSKKRDTKRGSRGEARQQGHESKQGNWTQKIKTDRRKTSDSPTLHTVYSAIHTLSSNHSPLINAASLDAHAAADLTRIRSGFRVLQHLPFSAFAPSSSSACSCFCLLVAMVHLHAELHGFLRHARGMVHWNEFNSITIARTRDW